MSEADLPTPETLRDENCYDLKLAKTDPYYLVPDYVHEDNRSRSRRDHCEGRAFATVGHVEWDGDWEKDWSPERTSCLVPACSKVGDLLCGLIGFEVAVVLRQVEDGAYQLVGTSTCWELTIAQEAPDLDWSNLASEYPQSPLQDFCLL